jgi:hypothetical protein
VTKTLHADPYITLTHDEPARLVRYTRSAEPYPSLDTLRDCNAKLRAAFAKLPDGTLSLLVDVRDAPPRNDAAFEAEVLEALRVIAEKFARRASLVRTAVGRLQTQRLAREREDAVQVFTDEAAALAYLTRSTPR